jgi:hypothetical protein
MAAKQPMNGSRTAQRARTRKSLLPPAFKENGNRRTLSALRNLFGIRLLSYSTSTPGGLPKEIAAVSGRSSVI